MVHLTPVVSEYLSKNHREILSFLETMIEKGTLKAYDPADMVAVHKLCEREIYIIEDPATRSKYFVRTDSEGGMFYDDGDSQTIYNHFIAEKLVDNVKYPEIKSIRDFPPEWLVLARLRVDHNDNWVSAGETDYLRSQYGSLVIEGKADSLFEKIYEFMHDT